MPEYISREMATAYAPLPKSLREYQTGNLDDAWESGYKYAIDQIDAIPAADVVEVKRGRWIKENGSWFTPGGDPVWECSECGKGRHVYGVEHGTYGSDVADGQWVSCPNCGCAMSGKGINVPSKDGGSEDAG